MSVVRLRQFLIGLYHDLPNILFSGSLVLGSVTGYLPLVWVSMGLIVNAFGVASLQGLFELLFDTSSKGFLASQLIVPKNAACNIITGGNQALVKRQSLPPAIGYPPRYSLRRLLSIIPYKSR